MIKNKYLTTFWGKRSNELYREFRKKRKKLNRISKRSRQINR
ncbi:hypothetical protein LCGC14_2427950 [marine sediment metagenome]|uniref:Uncharacterized protein n=1 Tax=marine sediment metagenome TaxID=412755 RepID=A0A0F9CA24_9ZZZZ